MVEGDSGIEKQVHDTTRQVLVEMHMTNWAEMQREDPVLNTVLNWLDAQKKTDLKTLLGEHASSGRGLTGLEELPEFFDTLESLKPLLNA